MPKEASRFTSIKLCSKMYSTTFALPVNAATCRTVWPILSTRLTSEPRCTMRFAAFTLPLFTASWSGEEPVESCAFSRLGLDATRKLITLSWPWNAVEIKKIEISYRYRKAFGWLENNLKIILPVCLYRFAFSNMNILKYFTVIYKIVSI